MRRFGKVQGLHIYLAITNDMVHRHRHFKGKTSYEISTLWDKKKGGLIDMEWVLPSNFRLFTVSWGWHK